MKILKLFSMVFVIVCCFQSAASAGTIFHYSCPREKRDLGTVKLGKGKSTPPESGGLELAYIPSEKRFAGIKVRHENYPDASAAVIEGEEEFMGKQTSFVKIDGTKKAYLYNGAVCPVCSRAKLDRRATGFWD